MGRDLGNSLGRYIETDKRSWLSEQAKFMRIRVDLPLNRPLREVILSTWMRAKLGLLSNLRGSFVFASNVDSWVTMNDTTLIFHTVPVRPNSMGFG